MSPRALLIIWSAVWQFSEKVTNQVKDPGLAQDFNGFWCLLSCAAHMSFTNGLRTSTPCRAGRWTLPVAKSWVKTTVCSRPIEAAVVFRQVFTLPELSVRLLKDARRKSSVGEVQHRLSHLELSKWPWFEKPHFLYHIYEQINKNLSDKQNIWWPAAKPKLRPVATNLDMGDGFRLDSYKWENRWFHYFRPGEFTWSTSDSQFMWFTRAALAYCRLFCAWTHHSMPRSLVTIETQWVSCCFGWSVCHIGPAPQHQKWTNLKMLLVNHHSE